MIGILLISHGNLASGMLDSVFCLRGEIEQLQALGLQAQESTDEFDHRLAETVASMKTGDGVLIFADINGGTPANRALMLASTDPEIEVLTGANLPLVLEAIDNRGELRIVELCQQLIAVFPHSVVHASRLLRDHLLEVQERSYKADPIPAGI